MNLSEVITRWKPEDHVDATIPEDSFLNSENILVCATDVPKNMKATDTPIQIEFIGLCERVSITSMQAIQTVYEIGSSLAYRISAQSRLAVNMATIYYQGPNLLYKLYKTYLEKDEEAKNYTLRLTSNDIDGKMYYTFAEDGTAGGIIYDFTPKVFRRPVGLILFYRFPLPKGDPSIGGFFVENLTIGTVGIDVGAGPIMMTDGVAGEAENITPVYPQVKDYKKT